MFEMILRLSFILIGSTILGILFDSVLALVGFGLIAIAVWVDKS